MDKCKIIGRRGYRADFFLNKLRMIQDNIEPTEKLNAIRIIGAC